MVVQVVQKALHVLIFSKIPHQAGDPVEFPIVGRQPVGLSVMHHLDPVFDSPEKVIGVFQILPDGPFQELQAVEDVQGSERSLDPCFGKLAAEDDLERLDHEFDLADTAPAHFDVHGIGFFPRDLPLNPLFHGPDFIQAAEIEIPPKDERPDHFQKRFADVPGPGDGSGLDQRPPFPRDGLRLVIQLSRIGGERHLAVLPPGPQPQVHTESRPHLGVRFKDCRNPSRPLDSCVVDLGRMGFPGRRIQVDQIYIRCEIELPRAHLAHSHDDEF